MTGGAHVKMCYILARDYFVMIGLVSPCWSHAQ
jgi:hypothetical protein